MKQLLVTGANGFVGQNFCNRIQKDGYKVRAATRDIESSKSLSSDIELIQIGSIGPSTDWTEAIKGIHSVVHLAARAHIMKDDAKNPLEEFRNVNTFGTKRLGLEAAKAGIRRFIYISSIKVNGEQTVKYPFSETDKPVTSDPYGISKLEAEKALYKISKESGMEVVIIRPPLIYGPGVKGNFLSLLNLINSGIPLPFGGIKNKRSLINIHNLCDLIKYCIEHHDAAGQIFLASDDDDLSTTELLCRIATKMGKRSLILPFPDKIMRWLLTTARNKSIYDRLYGSLSVDIRKAKKMLGWSPAYSIDFGLQETVNWYKNSRNKLN